MGPIANQFLETMFKVLEFPSKNLVDQKEVMLMFGTIPIDISIQKITKDVEGLLFIAQLSPTSADDTNNNNNINTMSKLLLLNSTPAILDAGAFGMLQNNSIVFSSFCSTNMMNEEYARVFITKYFQALSTWENIGTKLQQMPMLK